MGERKSKWMVDLVSSSLCVLRFCGFSKSKFYRFACACMIKCELCSNILISDSVAIVVF